MSVKSNLRLRKTSSAHVARARAQGPVQADFWAITAYFNPVGYRSRRENYHLFRQRLGLPLITVELGFEGGFELGPGDADILVQIRGGDRLWQKERLLNIATARLPDACRFVAWIDCDVLFEDPRWPEAALRVLERQPIAQPFDRLVHLRRGESPETAAAPEQKSLRTSFASRWRERSLPDDVFRRPEGTYECRCTCGMAWIARRELLERHGLYDAMVLGLGDKHVAAAATGQAEDAIHCTEMSPNHGDHYRRWAEPFWAEIRGDVGCVEGRLYHLWHGDLDNRRYLARYKGFSALDFDPTLDLARDASGAWRWGRDREELRQHVADYFHVRQEDGAGEGHLPLAAAQAPADRLP